MFTCKNRKYNETIPSFLVLLTQYTFFVGTCGAARRAFVGNHTNQADEAFVRVGDKSRKLTFEERVQLMYDKGERFYEDTAVYGATVDDIDMEAVANYAKMVGYGKSPMEYLRENNSFVTPNKKGEEDVSTACILLFGKNP